MGAARVRSSQIGVLKQTCTLCPPAFRIRGPAPPHGRGRGTGIPGRHSRAGRARISAPGTATAQRTPQVATRPAPAPLFSVPPPYFVLVLPVTMAAVTVNAFQKAGARPSTKGKSRATRVVVRAQVSGNSVVRCLSARPARPAAPQAAAGPLAVLNRIARRFDAARCSAGLRARQHRPRAAGCLHDGQQHGPRRVRRGGACTAAAGAPSPLHQAVAALAVNRPTPHTRHAPLPAPRRRP
jgi:hypothetical protein